MSKSGNDWNENGFFSGITEDYSYYRWFKGENENPFLGDAGRPLAATFWEYEKDFHLKFLDKADTSVSQAEAYKQWKAELIHEYLPGKSNSYNDRTDWQMVFDSGRK